ncbi:hypothetical protein AAFN85_30895 [Mucilaginibacter sp. CAU 1740]|uniref:hypothetical protein n=1 Tax=Mucilaginibacter sp. CAU 1740 TaxID=3140365 RepID=UPI00325A967B
MMMSKGFGLFCVVAFFAGLIFAVAMILKQQKAQKDGYEKTFESSFGGVITHISSNHSTIAIKLDHEREYIFVQETSSYLKRDATKFIEPGDSISKTAFSDIILIWQRGHVDSIRIDKPE